VRVHNFRGHFYTRSPQSALEGSIPELPLEQHRGNSSADS
jgi:hypothetical protein